ncbi:unnamed protein product [Ilex paraguariensis]|uniref:Uncharacterized protein n=1 Tax=Ilex paraguariensis TaxID=185542 RepID=A0ABC8R5I9_9AQUA
MEGGGRGGFGYGNLQTNPPPFRPSPPLSAIDRFLWDQTQPHFFQQQSLNDLQNKEPLVSGNGFYDFSSYSSSGGAMGGYACGVSWPDLPDTSFVDGLFLDEDTLNWIDPNVGLNEETKSAQTNSVDKGKRVKGGSSTNLIKGQWTEEEDSKLIRLVKQHGIKKWAHIAEKMFGRAGKQCRERWHNHLRPDIKKDSWNDEEEMLLVEGHEKFGNRWAEIAKHIPGRSENSIKNHWNATKRRQNSRRKSKKHEGEIVKPHPTILQEYMKRNGLNIITTSDSNTTTSTTPTNSAVSEGPSSQFSVLFPELSQTTDEDSPSLMAQTYDDELTFMKALFENKPKDSFVDDGKMVGRIEAKTSQNNYVNDSAGFNYVNDSAGFNSLGFKFNGNAECGFSSATPDTNMYFANNFQKEEAPKTPLYSDFYLSYLLDGATLLPSCEPSYGNMKMDMMMNEGTSGGKKKMDAVQMYSSSQFSHGSTSNSFMF